MAKRSQLVKKLDQVFSQWVRQSNANKRGDVVCFTCGKVSHWKKVDAGHFQTRAKYSTRWDEKNVKPQCKGCNMKNGGQQYVFGLNLDKEYGEGTADAILYKSNQLAKFSNGDLEYMIAHYKEKLKHL